MAREALERVRASREPDPGEEIEIEVSGSQLGVEIMAPPGMEEMTNQLQSRNNFV